MSEPDSGFLPQDPAELAGFGRLELIARQLVEGVMMGRHRSPFKGSSVEFVEHREYCPGDEIRHIDWRAFGKTGRYYVKEFEDETNLRVHLLIDASGSMSYSGMGLSKFEYARILSAALAWLLLSQRDSVGLVLFDSVVRAQLKPSSHPDQYRRIVQLLEAAVPGGETGAAGILESLLPTLPRRGLLILISDCLDSIENLRRVFRQIRHAKQELVVFRIAAPEEELFPFNHPTQFCDLEDADHRLLVDPVRLRREYLRQYKQFSEQLEREAGLLGIDLRRLLSSQPLQQALGTWLEDRMSAPRRRQ